MSVNIMGCSEEVSFQVFSELSWISHGTQIFRQSVPCRRSCVWERTFSEFCAQLWQRVVGRPKWCWPEAATCTAGDTDTSGFHNVGQISWTRPVENRRRDIAILSLTGVCSSIVNKHTWYCDKYNDLLIQYNTMHSRLQYYVGYLTVTMAISLSNFNSNHMLWFIPYQRYVITTTQWLLFYVGQCDSKNEKVWSQWLWQLFWLTP